MGTTPNPAPRLCLDLHLRRGAEDDLAVLDGIGIARQLGVVVIFSMGADLSGWAVNCFPDGSARRYRNGPSFRIKDGKQVGPVFHRIEEWKDMEWVEVPQ